MEEQMRTILSKKELERLTFSEDGKSVTVDVHGMSENGMKHFLKNIACLYRFKFELTVIHGFNHGTTLLEAIRTKGFFTRSYSLLMYEDNPGMTTICFN